MSSHRQQKVRELLKRAIGEVVRREFNASETGLITVNDVDCTGDLKSAVVFISILGSEDQQKYALKSLTAQSSRLRGLLSKAVVLRYTPTLRFVVDDSVVRGNRVMQIIDELEKTSPANPQPEDEE
jgi:ribosome-binding factor A